MENERPTARDITKKTLGNKALVIYRQNSKLDSIRDVIEEELKGKSEYDFIENYYRIKTKVFLKGTPEEKISEWASNQSFDLGDLLLTDQTFKRSTADKIRNKIYSLDKIYKEACKETARDAKSKIMRKAGEIYGQKISDENEIKKDAKVINSFDTKINKIYLAIPRIGDHQFSDARKEIKNSLQDSDFRTEHDERPYLKNSVVKTTAAKKFLDEKLFLSSPGIEAIIAEKFSSALKNEGYEVELVNDFVPFNKMEENSLYLRDSHFTESSTDWDSGCENDTRESKKEGNKTKLLLDDLYSDAVKLGFWSMDEAVDKKQQKQIFEDTLKSKVRGAIGSIRQLRGAKEKYKF